MNMSENIDKYNQAFMETFSVNKNELEVLAYESIDAWDSIGHMNLIGELEDAFDIEIETNDVIAFASYEKGKEILKKYGIEL